MNLYTHNVTTWKHEKCYEIFCKWGPRWTSSSKCRVLPSEGYGECVMIRISNCRYNSLELANLNTTTQNSYIHVKYQRHFVVTIILNRSVWSLSSRIESF